MSRRLLVGLTGCLLLGCATPRGMAPGQSYVLTTKPVLHKQSIAWHLIDVTVLSPVAQGFNVVQVGRTVIGHHVPASDLVHGEVPDSSFFVNRRIDALSAEEIRRGPTRPGHELMPPLQITKFKDEGKTGGFFATDAKGDRYLCKLDLPGYPELLSGAEPVSSKLLWALGYYVPSYEVAELPREALHLSPKLREEELDELLAGRLIDGKVRMCASRLLDGEILGPFRFKDYRQLAELRGLKLAYAWINNTDAKDHNSLMVWTGDHAVGYLIDFGSSLGADAGHGPKRPCQGWLNDVDIKNFTLEMMTFGFHKSGCELPERPAGPTVGLFSPRLDPRRWKPYAPNLAFESMTVTDAQWMARRLARFSRAQLEAAVSAGRYDRAADAERIVDTLEARRAAILQVYLPTPPIVGPRELRPALKASPQQAPKLGPMPSVAR